MAKKRKLAKPTRQTAPTRPQFHTTTYEITFEPIENATFRKLPSAVKEQLETLYTTAQTRPQEAIPALLEIQKAYPALPLVYNYLSIAYSLAGETAKAEAVIHENYQKNPTYLFARLNYAELCLANGDYAQVAQVLDHKFDLKLLYPQRRQFHVSEFASFMMIVGSYFLATGNLPLAEKIYTTLAQVVPHHPLTEQLRAKIYPGVLQRLLSRLSG